MTCKLYKLNNLLIIFPRLLSTSSLFNLVTYNLINKINPKSKLKVSKLIIYDDKFCNPYKDILLLLLSNINLYSVLFYFMVIIKIFN